jgi:hypothetical protein
MCETMYSRFELETDGRSTEMGPEERWLSMAVGACLAAYGLSRLRLRALAALGVGSYLVYRGSTGRCPLGEQVNQRLGDGAWAEQKSWGTPLAEGWSGEAEPAPVEERSLSKVDCIDEAAMESFPASDPPSYTGAAVKPTVRIE